MKISVTENHAGTPEQVIKFENLGEMAKFVDPKVKSGTGLWSAKLDPHRKNIEQSLYLASRDTIRAVGTRPFNRVDSLAETIQLAKYGWREGRERLAEWQAILEEEFRKQIAKPTFEPNLSGIEVDVPALLSGQPEHMLDYIPAQTKARSVKIVVDLNVRCDACGRRHHDAEPTPPEWVLTRGAAVTMLIRALILANYQPEVVVRTTSWYQKFGMKDIGSIWPDCYTAPFLRTIEVPIHRPSEVMDVDRINFVLSHDSFVRRMEFRVHEILNLHDMDGVMQTTKTGSARRGTANFVGDLPLPESDLARFRSGLDEGDLFIPCPATVLDATYRQAERSRVVNPQEIHEHDYALPRVLQPDTNTREGANGFPKAFTSPAGAIMWVFAVLDDFGVQLA